MLFNELDKLKRSAIMTTIVLMFIGHILLVIPESYISVIGGALGFGLLVTACMVLFHFIGSRKALVHYIELTLGLFSGLLGVLIFVFDDLILKILSWLVATVPIILGFYGIYHALAFARRTGRRGWWILIVLSAVLLIFGSITFVHPWMDSPRAVMQVMGGTLMYSAFVSALRLVWLWPTRQD